MAKQPYRKPLPKNKNQAPAKRKQEKRPQLTVLYYIFTGFLVLFVPVFYYKHAMDVTLMPRTLVVSLFLFIITLFIFSKKMSRKIDFSPMRSWLFPAVIGYLLITILSATWAHNSRESYFDIVRTTLFLFLLLYAAIIFHNHEDWHKKLPKMVILATLVAVVIGFVQYYNDVYMATSDKLPDRRNLIYAVIGVMSHKNEFSNALMLLIPFLAYGAYIYRREWRFLAILALALNLVLIVLLKTRGVWVGIALSAFMTGVILIAAGNRVNLARVWRFVILGVFALGVAGMVWIYSIPKEGNAYSVIGRIQYLTDPQTKHNRGRVLVWQATMEMIKEKPFHGVGAGNWQIHIAPYCKGMFVEIKELNWGRPHNDFLWVWAEKGLFGLLLYLSLFTITLIYLFRVFFRGSDIKYRVLALLLAGGVISYLSPSFFSFPYERINHTVYLALFMAAAVVLNRKVKTAKVYRPPHKPFLAIAVVMLGFGIIYGYHSVRMEVYMKRTISSEKSERFEDAIYWANKSKNPFRSLNPMSYPPEYYVAKSDYEIGKRLLASGQEDAGNARIDEALRGFEKTLEIFPGNVWTISRMGLIYIDRKEHEKALESIDYMLELVPTLKQELKAKASIQYQMGDYHGAIESFKRIPRYEKDKEIVRNIEGLERLIEKEEEGE